MNIKTLLKIAIIAALVALPAAAGATTPSDIYTIGMTKGAQFVYWDIDANTGKKTTTTVNMGPAVFEEEEYLFYFDNSNPYKLWVEDEDFYGEGYYFYFDSWDSTLLRQAENLYSGSCVVYMYLLTDAHGNPIKSSDNWYTYMENNPGRYKYFYIEGALHMNAVFSPKNQTVVVQTSGFVPMEAELDNYSSYSGTYTETSWSYGDCSLNIPPFTMYYMYY